jgi:hypothetical protein
MHVVVFVARIKAQRDETGRRILLGDNSGGGVVVLQPIAFQCIATWNSNEFPDHRDSYQHDFRVTPRETFLACHRGQTLMEPPPPLCSLHILQ